MMHGGGGGGGLTQAVCRRVWQLADLADGVASHAAGAQADQGAQAGPGCGGRGGVLGQALHHLRVLQAGVERANVGVCAHEHILGSGLQQRPRRPHLHDSQKLREYGAVQPGIWILCPKGLTPDGLRWPVWLLVMDVNRTCFWLTPSAFASNEA